MVSEYKTLIVVDTNKIRNNFEWDKDYSKFEFKGDFEKLIKWIEDNKLQNLVFLGLPEIVIEEVITTRCQNFAKSIETLQQQISKLKNLPCYDGEITLDNNFNYRDFIIRCINEYIHKKSFILILKLDKDKYSIVLQRLVEKAIYKKKPFNKSDKGFKDALIWEIILNLCVEEYSNIFLLTENLNDFKELTEEFKDEFSTDIFLEADTNKLIVSLEYIYDIYIKYPTLVAFIKTDYFKSLVMEVLSEQNIHINNFNIKRIITIKDASVIDIEKFELDQSYSEDLLGLNIIKFLFENDNQEFNAELIIDSTANEILGLNYEEVES